MALATIHELETELRTLLTTLPSFVDNGYSVFSVDDFEAKIAGMTLPVAGVVYSGAEVQGNSVTPHGNTNTGVVVLEVQFIIVVAVQYQYTGADDTKPQAYALMDDVRAKVLGYKGVNSRPWRFLGEGPEVGASGDGVAFYSQNWATSLPTVGNSQ